MVGWGLIRGRGIKFDLYIGYICLLFFLKENHTSTKILSAAKNNDSSDFLTSLVGDPNKPESNRKKMFQLLLSRITNIKIHGKQETFFLNNNLHHTLVFCAKKAVLISLSYNKI